jgi:hypothetical protein
MNSSYIEYQGIDKQFLAFSELKQEFALSDGPPFWLCFDFQDYSQEVRYGKVAIEMAFLAAKLIVDNSIFSTDLYILPFKQNYSVGFPDDTF